MLLAIHIAAGGLAIILGAVALLTKKGGTIHRRAGLMFVWTMLAMGSTGSILGFFKTPKENVFAVFMVGYFVLTALTTVRPATSWTRLINVVGLVIAIGLAILDLLGGVKALNSPRGWYSGAPYPMFFFLATIMLLSAAGDVRIMRSGMLRGGARLGRHLWRMCFALFIAAGSFFSIRSRVAKILPTPFTTAPMRALPILLLFGAMFYWLWRVRSRRALPVLVRHDSTPLGATAGED